MRQNLVKILLSSSVVQKTTCSLQFTMWSNQNPLQSQNSLSTVTYIWLRDYFYLMRTSRTSQLKKGMDNKELSLVIGAEKIVVALFFFQVQFSDAGGCLVAQAAISFFVDLCLVFFFFLFTGKVVHM